MYYQNYEDYMKNILGNNYTQDEYVNSSRQFYPYNYNYYVPTYTQPITNEFQNNNASMMSAAEKKDTLEVSNMNNNINVSNNITKIKKMYPDIYVILNPMVEKTIQENKDKEITEEVLNVMTNKIYDSVEEDMSVNTRSVSNNNQLQENRNRSLNQTSQVSAQVTTSNLTKNAIRRIGNPTLRDLIKILLINKILENLSGNNRPEGPENRPPMRPIPRPDYRPPVMPMPRGTYPVMNYFVTPYPEDENYIS